MGRPNVYPRGNMTCFPSQKFAFPRAYIHRVGTRANTSIPLWTGRRLDLYDPPTGTIAWTLIFKEDFWNWNSNRWTLDWVLEASFNTYGTPPTDHALDMFVWYVVDPLTGQGTIEISPFFGQPYLFAHDLPPAPPGYWFPP